MSIGTNIKRLRESHNLSQAELGKIANVTDKAVSTWENDIKIPRMGAIQKIADYFGVSKSDIIEEVQEQQSMKITDNDIKFALFGTSDIDDDLYEDVKRLAKIQKMLRDQKEGD